ncbi:MAG TPA: ATP-binding protein [Chryseolinea sp.]
MKIRDIVNRDLVSLENCESEPIHIPGSIQPHGFLVAIHGKERTIDYCSGNIHEYIGIRPEQALGKSISVLLTPSDNDSLVDYLERRPTYADAPLRLKIANVQLECVSHQAQERTILEFERESQAPLDNQALYVQTRQFINNIETSSSLRALCQSVADEVKQITGYDRVMIYRFDEQYNGEIFAESLSENIEPFLGLHYPHSGIPVQARELYIKNLLRLIPDVYYKPVPVFTIDSGQAKALDMSFTALRSVSPIHLQYLQNMGVGATLTISLVHEQKLWGLIACHHYSPKYLSNAIKVSAKLQGHFLTSQIKVREANEEYSISKNVDASLQTLISDNIPIDHETLQTLINRQELLTICHASGVAISINNKIYRAGNTLNDDELTKLIRWIVYHTPYPSFITDRLYVEYPGGERLTDCAAGVIYHSLGASNNSIVWFRHETLKEVHWGGDPQKAILKDERGLHPRKSFALWKEIVKGRSNPWLKPETNAAANFAHFLQRQVHLMFITEEEARYRELSYKLQEANAELENINWISAHDLKEPLRKIQVFASRILEKEKDLPGNVVKSVNRMSASAQRMQTLILDILRYSRVTKIKDAVVPVDLNQVLKQCLDEIKEEIEEQNATVQVEPLPVINGIAFMLNQLFLNLLRNALKFRKADVPPIIKITYTTTLENPFGPGKKFHLISVSDNGIGFGNDFKEDIFDVFTRLHTRETYHGSGIGLAVCRKIMQNHGGKIVAEGKEGQGATFRMYFPL